VADRRIGGSTRVVAVLGWPVAHSLSPVIHNAAFDALGLDWTYVALPVGPDHVPEAVAGLAALGFAGANVTMPHKEAVADTVDRVSEDAERLRAVNTIEFVGGGSVGHNTDAPGFARFLERDAAFDPAGRTALLYGAGGAARACALALARAGLIRLVVALRVPARAKDLEAALEGFPTAVDVVAFEDAGDVATDLLVNATPLGVHDEELPLPRLGRATVAVYLLYRPTITPMQQAVRDAGGAAFGGLGLLLHQAALSFEIWTAQEPPLEVMSAAALAALADT
jgi:shikimate dehydrogenase